MRMERLTQADGPVYKTAMDIYRMSFPPHEQRDARTQPSVMKKQAYHFQCLYEQEEWVGLLLYWETDNFFYVEHFCIAPALRNRGYGRKALEQLHGKGKTVILEIDPPEDTLSCRRQTFYQRLGYKVNDIAHIHPPYQHNNEGHRLVVMSYPQSLSRAQYDAFWQYLTEVVMAR